MIEVQQVVGKSLFGATYLHDLRVLRLSELLSGISRAIGQIRGKERHT